MPEIQSLSPVPTLSCDLCRRHYPAAEVALRGRLSFCQTCAYERADECLVQLQGRRKKSRWPALIVAVLCLSLIVGAGWWTVNTPQFHNLLAAMAAQQPQHQPPAPSVPPVVTSAPVVGPTWSAEKLEDKAVPWIQHLFTNQGQRSVEDAGQIHLLFVTRPGTDSCRGMASLLFVTREASGGDSAKLVTEVGPQMATSFDEGLRYVRKQPRDWERDFSIRLSFEDKFTSKDGGSAGTGFTLAMLAATQRVALDPDVAVTGDLTIDGTVQPVGAVVEKLRGAIEGKCKITLVPERNARDVVDLALLDGTSPLWETQIFSIGTINQALGLARQDRAEDIKNAVTRFDALRARLPAVVTPNYLQSPVVQAELKEVLRLAPNHLSASTLLRAAEGQLPHELSLNRSVDEILATSYLFVGNLLGKEGSQPAPTSNNGVTIFPEREYDHCLKAIQRLTPILDPRSLELKAACVTYSGCLRSVATYQPVDFSVRRTREVLMRERSFQQQTLEDMQEARSHLLLALRKLDTDGSMVSELQKK